MTPTRCSSVFLLAILAAACAAGPRYIDVVSSLPAIKSNQGRVYVYRGANPLGGALQPAILANGHYIGDAKPDGFIFVDLPPGPVEVRLSTEGEKKATFVLERGQTRYVRASVASLYVVSVYPELVDEATGKAEIQRKLYMGTEHVPR